MSKALEVSRLSKNYGPLKAVDNVSFDIAEGEMFGLIGPDGAGKSSIYRILATLALPDAGEVSILGLDLLKDYRKIRTQIGYMPEQFSLYPDLTVRENLRFFASLFDVPIEKNYSLIAPIFGQLEKFPDRLAGRLSGGMKQKLALSCALIHKPRLLLLDEPTTGVDAVSRSEFWDMLAGLREKGITILVSTSYMDEATRCDRIAMIDHGHILISDSPSRLEGKLDENLFAASARDMFRLLEELRRLPDVIDCYTFGASLHLVGNGSFNPVEAETSIRKEGIQDVRIERTKGDLEDLFIKLTRDERAG